MRDAPSDLDVDDRGARSYFTTSDGRRLHFVDHGGDVPVLLIQGLSLAAAHWFDLPRRLQHQPARWRPITLDNRGTGHSDRVQRPFDLGRLADDCAELLDALDVDHARVVGLSMGGMIAQHLALRHPRRVSSLVLVATTACVRSRPWPRRESVKTILDGMIRRPSSLDPLARLLLGPAHIQDAARILAPFAALARRGPLTPRGTILAQLADVGRHDLRQRLHLVECPVTVLAGAEDRLVPVEHARALATRVPGAELRELSGVGHGLPWSVPDAIPDALRAHAPLY